MIENILLMILFMHMNVWNQSTLNVRQQYPQRENNRYCILKATCILCPKMERQRERERKRRQKSTRRLLDFMVRSYFYCRKQEIIICRCNYTLVMFSYRQTYFNWLIIKLLYTLYNCTFYIVQFNKNLNTKTHFYQTKNNPFECLYEWRYIDVRNITS